MVRGFELFGAKYAEGTVVIGTSGLSFNRLTTGIPNWVANNHRYIQVSGLSFKPRLIFVWKVSNSNFNEFQNTFVVYNEIRITAWQNSNNNLDTTEAKIITGTSAYSGAGSPNIFELSNSAFVNESSFRLPLHMSSLSGTLNWVAFA